MKTKLLAFDLDGTLLHPILSDKLISDEYIKMLQDFYDSGISLCIVTGRGINFATKVEKNIGRRCYKVCFNGAYVPECNYFSSINRHVVKELYNTDDRILFFDKDATIYAREKDMEFFKKDYNNRMKEKPFYTECYVYNDDLLNESIESSRIGKIIIYDKDVIIDENVVNVARKPSSNNAEIINIGNNKRNGVDLVAKHLSINDNDVFVVGDEENDKDMLSDYKNSFIIDHPYNRNLNISRYRIDNMLELKKYIKVD